MPQEWFVRRGDKVRGPLTSEEMKQLVAKGILARSDMVRKSENSDWQNAGTIKGLFVPETSTPSVPPPLPQVKVDTPVASVTPPPTQTSANRKASSSPPPAAKAVDTMQAGLADIMSTAKQAKDLTASHARRTQLTQMTLPKAFLALGNDVIVSGRYRDEFSELFQRISGADNEIAKVAASNRERPQATDLKGKLQSGAAQIMAQGQTTKLGFQRDSLVRSLGKKAFESHGHSAGSPELVSPIISANEEVAVLDDKIGKLSSGDKGPLWHRLPLAALLTVFCWPLGMLLVWLNPRLTRRNKTIWTGTSFLLLAALISFELREQRELNTKSNDGTSTIKKSTTSRSNPSQNDSPSHAKSSEKSNNYEIDENILNMEVPAMREAESASIVRILKTPSQVVEASHSGPELLLTPDGNYLFDHSDMLHIPSGKWAFYRTSGRTCIAPSNNEIASTDFNHEVKINQVQLSLFSLNGGEPVTKKVTLNLAEGPFPHGYQYLEPKYSSDGQFIVIGLGQGLVYGFVIFSVTPQLHEVARFYTPKTERMGNHRAVRNVQGHIQGIWSENIQLSRTHMLVPFDDMICVYELKTGTLVASWEIAGGQLLGFASQKGDIACVTGEYSDRIVEILGPDKTSRRKLLKLEETDFRSVVTLRPDENEIILASSKGWMEYISLTDAKVKRAVQVPRYQSGVFEVVSHDRKHAVFLSTDGFLNVWSLEDAMPIACLGPTTADIPLAITVADGGKLVASAHRKSKRIEIWKVDDGVLGPVPSMTTVADALAETTNIVRQYFALTEIEKKQGWFIPDKGHGQRVPAPPMAAETFARITKGMNAFQVAAQVGGWAHKGKVEHRRDGTDWNYRHTQIYVGDKPGSVIVLQFETDRSTGQDILVNKMSRGL